MFPSRSKRAAHLPWTRITNIGNHLRHAYHRVDAEILWKIYETGELFELRDAIAGFVGSMD